MWPKCKLSALIQGVLNSFYIKHLKIRAIFIHTIFWGSHLMGRLTEKQFHGQVKLLFCHFMINQADIIATIWFIVKKNCMHWVAQQQCPERLQKMTKIHEGGN